MRYQWNEDSCRAINQSDGRTSHQYQPLSFLPGNSIKPTPKESSTDPSFLKACLSGDEAELRQIILKGLSTATINQQDDCGRTGLWHICSKDFLEMFQLVAQLPGLDVNLPDNEGCTPVMISAQAGHAEILGLMINIFQNSLIIDQRNTFGMTALMKAALQGRNRCVKLLLDSGANPYLRDPARKLSPYEWAKFCGRQTCAESIEKFMKSHSKKKFSSLHRKEATLGKKWPSDSQLCPDNNALPPSNTELVKVGGGWLKQKLRNPFRYSNNRARRSADFSVFNNITASAMLCASSAILQNSEAEVSDKKNKTRRASGKRKFVVPKVEVAQESLCPQTNDCFPTGTTPPFKETPLQVTKPLVPVSRKRKESKQKN
ncbi:ankyrin repeat domain-containing protein 33B-like isoform X2 [Limulus polyphemus]|uniref:Ankyrin repeat domain-containing protein 33B-like isoform X2 n=1 Tax=Limulus polyphemus TaxID=6850 RepID=A0ABM1BN64_LIMPO|nr:ankyrin repeat domain-containing protein 33B-like isoform X2 [Limulus polyphemus]